MLTNASYNVATYLLFHQQPKAMLLESFHYFAAAVIINNYSFTVTCVVANKLPFNNVDISVDIRSCTVVDY